MSVISTTVTEATLVAPNVVFLKLARPEGFSWTTGQFAIMGVKKDGENLMRCYSIASPGNSDTVDFYVANVKDGALSPLLNKLKAGDTALLDTEVGGMLLPERLEENGKDLWLFASGTGVAPFMAITADKSVAEKYENIVLVHGVRTWSETEYVGRNITLQPRLQAIACVTRDKGAMITKRIPDALADGDLERISGLTIDPARTRVMICGNPPMAKAVREWMKTKGIVSPRGGKPGQLLAESFG